MKWSRGVLGQAKGLRYEGKWERIKSPTPTTVSISNVRDLGFGDRLQPQQLVATQSRKQNYKMQRLCSASQCGDPFSQGGVSYVWGATYPDLSGTRQSCLGSRRQLEENKR